MVTRRPWVLAAALVGTFLASVDVTVVGTAMPTIVGQLGGLPLFPWVFSIYLLTSTVTVPLYGKAADLFGRKPAYLTGVILFVGGSLLCATSSTMTQLIVWRAVQGIGAGGVIPITLTIVGDLYPAQQRARVQGLFSAVWAVSSVSGPALGAFIVQYWAWEWIFIVNLPFGVVAAGLMIVGLHEQVERARHRLDLWGAVWLTVSAATLMWALLGGGDVGFLQPMILISLVAAAITGLLFVVNEKRHPEPMIPPALLVDPVVRVACIAGLAMGGVLFGVSSYVPAFVQGALGGGPADAGISVLPMGIGWPIASNLTGWTLRKIGYRASALLGGAFLAIGGLGLLTFDLETPRALVMGVVGVIGLGMGFSTTTLLIAAQEVVPWNRRGAVTGLVQFSRTIGGAIGVAAMGAVLAATLRARLSGQPELLEVANAIMDPHKRAGVPLEAVQTVRQTLNLGLGRVLIGVAASAVAAFLAMAFFPRAAVEGQPSRPSTTGAASETSPS